MYKNYVFLFKYTFDKLHLHCYYYKCDYYYYYYYYD